MPSESKNKKQPDSAELLELVNSRIEKIRPKLLDLTRRNPLLSTRFSDRSHSHIRIVDELPQIIFNQLIEGKMCFNPLPPLEQDPKDEKTLEFQKALADARITDQIYTETLDKINQDVDESADQLAVAERDLKDRLRVKLKMSPRQTKTNLSLAQHAKNNDILPYYDLPLPKDKHKDGRHIDDLMQTLLLPDFMQKKLNSLMTKHRTWIQETGISVLSAAFGFLEWVESSSSKTCLAPLVLLPVEIEKKKTRHGFEYCVSSKGELPEINTVLAEKFKLDFGIELPVFDAANMDLERYFNEIVKMCENEPSWKVKRQVAIGVFPSARMAMYHDLNTKSWDFTNHDIIKDLMGSGRNDNVDVPFAEDYEIDKPSIEAKVPLLVMDADSSQHSVVVDVMDNKSIAVEGPPGTGKSQTIVNAIAAALCNNKKVLFVAEKMAALEVVRSRLEACGLGEFLLTLQATRSSKKQVVQSIRKRMLMKKEWDPEELDEKISQFKGVRTQIDKYIQLISSYFTGTTFTVHEILGWGIMAHHRLTALNIKHATPKMPDMRNINKQKLDDIYHLCVQLEACWRKVNSCSTYWSSIKRPNIDPYTAEEILLSAKKSAEFYAESSNKRKNLSDLLLDTETNKQELLILRELLKQALDDYDNINIPFIGRVAENDALEAVVTFFAESERMLALKDDLSKAVVDPLQPGVSNSFMHLANAIVKIGIDEPSEDKANAIIESLEKEITSKQIARDFVENIFKLVSGIKENKLSTIVTFLDIASSVPKSVLSLRSDILGSSEAKEIITKAESKSQKLLLQQKALEEIFCSVKTVKLNEIEEALKIFISSGFFAVFSPKYHKAKRYYRSIAKDEKFKKDQVTHQMRELQEWIMSKDEFERDEKIKHFIGTHFDGLETDFEPFVQLVNYYDRIDSELKGTDGIASKTYLQKGDLSTLLNLTRVESNHPIRFQKENSYKKLNTRLGDLEIKLKSLKNCKKIITEHSKLLTHIEGINAGTLRQLGAELESLQTNWNKLSTDRIIRKILDAEFSGPILLPDQLKISIALLKKMKLAEKNISNSVLKSLKSDQMQRNLEMVISVINQDNIAEESLKKLEKAVNADAINKEPLLKHKELSKFLLKCSKDKEGLISYSQFYSAKLELSSKGYGEVVDTLLELPVGLKELSKTLSALIGQSLAKKVYNEFGSMLANYTGIKLNRLRSRIAKLDKEILDLSKKRLRAMLKSKAYPPRGQRSGRRSEWTDMALLNNEITKEKRHLPARELTKRASGALLALKPCWMMSPLAVAQYIDKGHMAFDLLIIDEASQMTPENALGAIARSKQVMVVGDTNQLPPSSFFKRYIDTTDEEDEESVTEESILEMANSVFKPPRRLKWHYRSKYPELIAFSNKYVYNNELVIFPSPNIHTSAKRVSFCKVNGLYSSGTNPIEATKLSNAAIDFMHHHKDMSLGIVLLNLRQRDLVIDELEYRISKDSIAQEYIENWETKRDGLESFFIKNLENVQGDERDVIFIGTVYGPEKENVPVMQRFGPINGINGKRRLNVLFSRSKHKIVTFSSMTANDIRVDNQSNEGVALLKSWLEYCASGKLLTSLVKGKEPGSDFEKYVILQLKSIGCQPISQVGVAGYFIDIGVKHPKWPHGFMMGIECDGATYHSSKSARDRDRLREEVLVGLGWRLHRIWSTDWFTDPVNEAERMRSAIEQRMEELIEKSNDFFR